MPPGPDFRQENLMPRRFSADENEAFFRAVEKNDVNLVQKCLDAGFPPDLTREGTSALHRAASKGNLQMLNVLLAAGASVNQLMTGDKNVGWARTALNAASAHGHIGAITLLLDYGAVPRIPNDAGDTAAHLLAAAWTYVAAKQPAVMQDQSLDVDPDSGPFRRFDACSVAETLSRMLDLGVPINQTNCSGETILHQLAGLTGMSAVAINMLLERKADPNIRDKDGKTPLHRAVQQHAPVHGIASLIEHGADIEVATHDGRTPLHCCNEKNLQALLAGSPNLEAQDIYGRTALAARIDEIKPQVSSIVPIVAMLIDAGASLDTADFTGVTPRAIVKARKHYAIESLINATNARAAMRHAAGMAHGPTPQA
jgi:ankyrin repeat protein